jgi:hypothetical protein
MLQGAAEEEYFMSHLLLRKQFNLTRQRDKLEVRLCKNKDIIVVFHSRLLSSQHSGTESELAYHRSLRKFLLK